MKKLLIHTCCADCALKMEQSLSSLIEQPIFEKFLKKSDIKSPNRKFADIKNPNFVKMPGEMLFYFANDNIHPRSEWLSRYRALKKIAKEQNWKIVVKNYRPSDYFEHILSLGNFPEETQRCPVCWRLRLKNSFDYAAAHEFDLVTTTLLSSHYQASKIITRIAEDIAQQYPQVDFWQPPQINKDLEFKGFYKQNYCGCAFSLVERMSEKYSAE